MPAETDSLFALPDAVQWSEGMLLSPQHLQQNDIYWHAQMRAHGASLDPDHWGLLSLAIDTRALADGVLVVKSLRAVMPDGLLLEFPVADERRTLRLELKDALPGDGRPLRVWLAVPRRGGDAARQDGFMQRYDSLPGEPAVDENSGGNPVPVQRLRPNLTLLADETQLARYITCPLLEVLRDVNGHISLGGYHPPASRLGASAFLGDNGLAWLLPDLARRVWVKVRELVGERDDRDDDSILTQENRQHLGVARLLAVALPHFDVLVGTPDSHPRAAYHALALLAGQAAALGGNPLPPQLAPYRHDECEAQFRIALDYVKRKLALVNTVLERLPFARLGESGFARHLPAGSLADDLVIELKPRVGQGSKELQAWLNNARVASDDLMSTLRLRRLPGARVRALQRGELEALGLNAAAALFLVSNQSIELDGRGISVLRAGRSLVIQGMSEADMPAGILLYRWKGVQPSLAGGEAAAIAVLDEVVEFPEVASEVASEVANEVAKEVTSEVVFPVAPDFEPDFGSKPDAPGHA